jgi:fatty-acyl-CoA synthase
MRTDVRPIAHRVVDVPFLIRRAAVHGAGEIGVDDGMRSLTIGELVARGERAANRLDTLDLPPAATVGILSENRSEYAQADVAIALSRRTRVALNARLTLDDHRYVVADAGIKALVYSASFAGQAEALKNEFGLAIVCLDAEGSAGPLTLEGLIEDGRPASVVRTGGLEDPAWITYTSGTSGRPKGVVLSHRSIREVALNLLVELGPITPGEQLVMTQPLSHGAGYFLLPCLISGASIYAMRKFDPGETLAVGQRPEATVLQCVPAMLPALLESWDDRSLGYNSVVYGAAPIPRPVLGAALERFGPVLIQLYGQSEAPMTITCLQKRDHLGDGEQRFSAGRPFRSVGVEVWDDAGRPLSAGEQGEVVVSGSHLMSSYLGLPSETEAVLRDGWVLTRDVGMFDEQGFLYLAGRRDEMIISGGYNISPREVEQVLSMFVGVEEAAVVGVPDERWGSAVTAAVKPRQGEALVLDDLVAFARSRLSFRAPKRVKVVEAIPKTPYGKVDRAVLVDMLTSQVDRPV